MPDNAQSRRLIEDWLPINEISVEAIRERNAASALPPINWLHVWWARRPLSICRAAVAGCLLPADADQYRFYDLMGTYPEIVADQDRINAAKESGERLREPVYINPRRRMPGNKNHPRAFEHNLTAAERGWFGGNSAAADGAVVLDVTAGGGSIPFEAGRLGVR